VTVELAADNPVRAPKMRQKRAIDWCRWCLFSMVCDGFRLCFASD
jgi:hypothetical protein